MWLCVYACVCVCVHACVCVCVHACVCACVHTCMHVCVHSFALQHVVQTSSASITAAADGGGEPCPGFHGGPGCGRAAIPERHDVGPDTTPRNGPELATSVLHALSSVPCTAAAGATTPAGQLVPCADLCLLRWVVLSASLLQLQQFVL